MKQMHDIPTIKIHGHSFNEAFRFSHHAMATLFEIYIIHDDADYAHQAAWEAFRVLDRLEQELSLFIENSDISRVNHCPAKQPVQIGLDAFECLKQSLFWIERTNHAFDVTFGSLKRNKDLPFLLDEAHFKVTRLSDSIMIDLGGIGKGYAVDQMAGVLQEWEIGSALIHGGMSSVLALSEPPGEEGWLVTLSTPSIPSTLGGSKPKIPGVLTPSTHGGSEPRSKPHGVLPTLASILLKHKALSGSGLQKGQHIMDPRTGQPVEGRRAAWASASDAATSDALSTAFMVMHPDEIRAFCSNNSNVGAMVLLDSGEIINPRRF